MKKPLPGGLVSAYFMAMTMTIATQTAAIQNLSNVTTAHQTLRQYGSQRWQWRAVLDLASGQVYHQLRTPQQQR